MGHVGQNACIDRIGGKPVQRKPVGKDGSQCERWEYVGLERLKHAGKMPMCGVR